MEEALMVEDINRIMDLSEAASDYMTRQLHIAEFGPDATDVQILDKLYTIIEDELRERGIILIDDTFYSDWYLRRFLTDYHVITSGEYLKSIFMKTGSKKTRDKLIHDLGNLPVGQLIENLIVSLSVIHDDEYLGNCDSSIVSFSSTERFREHLKTILDSTFNDPYVLESVDGEAITRYIEVIEQGRRDIRKAIGYMTLNEKDIDHSYLNKMIDKYDLDKLTPEEIAIYSKIDRDDVHPALEDIKTKYMDRHHERSSHHVEYFISRNSLPFKTEDIIMLVGHHFNTGKDKDVIRDDVDKMIEDNPSTFPDEIRKRAHYFKDKLLLILSKFNDPSYNNK